MPISSAAVYPYFRITGLPSKLFAHSLIPKGMAGSFLSEAKALVFAEAAHSGKFSEVRS
jgi:hypothetical protein